MLSGSVFTNHSQEHSVSFSLGFVNMNVSHWTSFVDSVDQDQTASNVKSDLISTPSADTNMRSNSVSKAAKNIITYRPREISNTCI